MPDAQHAPSSSPSPLKSGINSSEGIQYKLAVMVFTRSSAFADDEAEVLVPNNSDPIDTYIDAAAQALGIPIEPEWKSEIRANLTVTFKLAAFVAEKELPDDAEPAPVYQA